MRLGVKITMVVRRVRHPALDRDAVDEERRHQPGPASSMVMGDVGDVGTGHQIPGGRSPWVTRAKAGEGDRLQTALRAEE